MSNANMIKSVRVESVCASAVQLMRPYPAAGDYYCKNISTYSSAWLKSLAQIAERVHLHHTYTHPVGHIVAMRSWCDDGRRASPLLTKPLHRKQARSDGERVCCTPVCPCPPGNRPRPPLRKNNGPIIRHRSQSQLSYGRSVRANRAAAAKWVAVRGGHVLDRRNK